MNEINDQQVTEMLDRVSVALGGERDVGKLLEAIAAAAPVDMHGSHDAAVTLATAVASAPLPGVPNVGVAERDFAERARHLGFLAEHAGGVPETKLREVESDAAAVALAKTLKPIAMAPPSPYTDRRPALREQRDLAKAQGNREGVEMLERELMLEEGRAATRAPTSTALWGGIARPLTPAA